MNCLQNSEKILL
jgi:hypothetical protein